MPIDADKLRKMKQMYVLWNVYKIFCNIICERDTVVRRDRIIDAIYIHLF